MENQVALCSTSMACLAGLFVMVLEVKAPCFFLLLNDILLVFASYLHKYPQLGEAIGLLSSPRMQMFFENTDTNVQLMRLL